MSVELDQFRSACKHFEPRDAFILGSGLGAVVDRIKFLLSIPFSAIPNLPRSSIYGHKGRLTLGEWVDVPAIIVEGRLHRYVGHEWHVVIEISRRLAELGIKRVIHTNAAGGIRDDLISGSLMVINDHVEMNYPGWHLDHESRKSSPYSTDLRERLLRSKFPLGVGVYGAVTGPSYETPAEIRAFRAWGIDAIGMSTTREVIAGVEAEMECAAISLITNRAAGLSSAVLNHQEVLETAKESIGALAEVFEEYLRGLKDDSGRADSNR